MRVSKEKAAENRERILDEAARLFRERGLSGIGVDALAEAAGLTYGSLYSHFGSKESLIAEAVGHAFGSFGTRLGRHERLSDYVAEYLSADHRDHPAEGCTAAALGCEMPRQSEAVRHRFTESFKLVMTRIAARFSGGRTREREDNALSMMATLVGAIVLARAVDDKALSDRILSVCRTRLKETISS